MLGCSILLGVGRLELGYRSKNALRRKEEGVDHAADLEGKAAEMERRFLGTLLLPHLMTWRALQM